MLMSFFSSLFTKPVRVQEKLNKPAHRGKWVRVWHFLMQKSNGYFNSQLEHLSVLRAWSDLIHLKRRAELVADKALNRSHLKMEINSRPSLTRCDRQMNSKCSADVLPVRSIYVLCAIRSIYFGLCCSFYLRCFALFFT